jgi:prepilin-type N-terminal cleavage/methylation domain-containing protein
VPSNRRGFTLIEVMVALTLLGLVATLLTSGTRLGLDVSARTNARADAVRTEQIERRLIHGQLLGALPYRYWTETEGKRIEHIAFEGEMDGVRFVSRNGMSDGPDNLPRWVELRRKATTDPLAPLVIEERQVLSPNNQPGESTIARAEMLTCPNARFEYLGKTGEKPEWLSSWTGPDRKAPLPFAIRIECKVPGNPVRLLIPLDYAESARLNLLFQ